MTKLEEVKNVDCVIMAVSHAYYVSMTLEDIDKLFHKDIPNCEKVIIDIKSILDKEVILGNKYRYWRL